MGRRAFAWGLATSVALHLAVLWLPVGVPRSGGTRAPERAPVVDGIELVTLAEPARDGAAATAPPRATPAASPPPPLDRRPEPAIDSPDPPPATPRIPAVGVGPPEPGGASDPGPPPTGLVGPRVGVPGLWRAVTDVPLSTEQLEHAALAPRVADYYSARRAAADDVEGMSSWVARDASGNNWGFSPGRVHLGPVPIPTCGARTGPAACGFGLAPNRGEAYRAWLARYEEIQLQGAREELARHYRELGAAIRVRRDVERGDTLRSPHR